MSHVSSLVELVVLAIGTTGAVEFFRPVQPVLGAVSVVLLGVAHHARWQTRATDDLGALGDRLEMTVQFE